MDRPSGIELLRQALQTFEGWKSQWPADADDTLFEASYRAAPEVLNELAIRLQGNFPFHSPMYAGQMLKPPHPVAWAAYALAMDINPNNHALDGGPPTSVMEKEVIRELGTLFGFEQPLGHLTSSGTIANLEALWIASRCAPGKKIAFTADAHYTHPRMCEVLGLPFVVLDELTDVTRHSDIGTLVVTLGTTGLGRVEPLHEVIGHCKSAGIRIHADAAYGGFFKLLGGPDWDLTGVVDSLVVDPHKHGMQPYGCGCVLFKDASVGQYYLHDSPYTYFSSDELHLGEISLECSRAGAAAAALWATMRVLPFERHRGLGMVLECCRSAALALAGRLQASGLYDILEPPQLDILAYVPVTGRPEASAISAASDAVFAQGMEGGPAGIWVSKYRIPTRRLAALRPGIVADAEFTTILRSVMMKPSHLTHIDDIADRLIRLRT
jgi:glutamate/tyrosine decarboxylase-like PLP-dependent enzyme